ncbi:hypothetical protein BDR26DRAFT_858213 [Obelidium mucronatum]|nr:hypothetical protein BDR26DRAFT_858213 [Obelidium mucronatum]
MISRFKTQVMNQSSSVSTSKFSFPHIGKRPIASITRSPSETEVEPDSKKLETTSDTIQAAAAISSSPSEIIKKKPWFPETVSKCTTEMDDPLHNPYTFKFKCPKKSAMKASSASATASASASLAISALPPPSKTKLQQEKSGSSSPIVVGDLDDQFLVKGYVDTEIQVSIVVSRLNTLLKDVVSHLEREIEALVGQKVRIVLMRTKDKDSEWVDVHVEEIDWRIRVSECWDHQMLVHLVVEV